MLKLLEGQKILKNQKILWHYLKIIETKQNIYCRDTIFNDPRMTLGSYVKGPNNIIQRVG